LFSQAHYGLFGNLNFPMVSGKTTDAVGRGLFGVGAFYQSAFTPYHHNKFLNSLDFTAELSMNYIGFRDKQTDFRYNNYYIDPAFFINYIPDRLSDDLRLMIGLRPSILMYQNNEKSDFGTYTIVRNEDRNLYKNGDLDFGLTGGISLSMGNIARIEVKYTHSFTNKMSDQIIKGRPSLIEFGLKLSAVDVRNTLTKREKTLSDQLLKQSKGTLLVMLETPNEKVIRKLKARNKTEEIYYLFEYQKQTNKMVIDEFKKQFDFCKIIYFMDSSAYKISKRDFNGAFVNAALEPIATDFDTSNYFIAAFCEDVSVVTNKIDYGLYFYDANFIQFRKPYNIGANNLNIFANGDPMSYFKRLKVTYNQNDFARIIKKANMRLRRFSIPY
jgi:hypothetical protein